MTTKISAMTTGTTANATDKIEIERSGTTRYITPAMLLTYIAANISSVGLLARYHNSADITYTNSSTTIINFNTSDYDPSSTVTTGASWHFTAPATARYDVRLVNAWIDHNTTVYAASNGIEIDVYKNGSVIGTLAYWEAETTTPFTHWIFFTGTFGVSLTSGDTIALKLFNFSGASRKLSISSLPAAIEIYRTT